MINVISAERDIYNGRNLRFQLTPLPKSYSALTSPASSKAGSPTGSDDEDSEDEYAQLQAHNSMDQSNASAASRPTAAGGAVNSPSCRPEAAAPQGTEVAKALKQMMI